MISAYEIYSIAMYVTVGMWGAVVVYLFIKALVHGEIKIN